MIYVTKWPPVGSCRVSSRAVLDAVPLGPASTASLRDGGIAFFTRPPGAEPDRDLRFETILVQTDPDALRGKVVLTP